MKFIFLFFFTTCLFAQYPAGLYAELETTRGTIVCKLHYQKTPMTVMNFVGLAQGEMPSNQPAGKPFYDGLIFHRVINNFMIQGGDPQGNGRGGPGYQFPDEIVSSLKHQSAGILSMANAGPGTNGSQFFITHNATPWLDGKHTVFGKVYQGQKIVDSIRQGDRIKKVTVVAIGESAKQFKVDPTAFKRWAGIRSL